MKKNPQPQDKHYDSDDNINDELTIESMLQVIDTKTGKSLDVRRMLNVKN